MTDNKTLLCQLARIRTLLEVNSDKYTTEDLLAYADEMESILKELKEQGT